mmetsp:Transcript_38574/g.90680  ORF Transcript_38574/g.90680 Transcript_38574/m.90680 type:complete len:306 (-) Transcript_38574:61-978(-)
MALRHRADRTLLGEDHHQVALLRWLRAARAHPGRARARHPLVQGHRGRRRRRRADGILPRQSRVRDRAGRRRRGAQVTPGGSERHLRQPGGTRRGHPPLHLRHRLAVCRGDRGRGRATADHTQRARPVGCRGRLPAVRLLCGGRRHHQQGEVRGRRRGRDRRRERALAHRPRARDQPAREHLRAHKAIEPRAARSALSIALRWQIPEASSLSHLRSAAERRAGARRHGQRQTPPQGRAVPVIGRAASWSAMPHGHTAKLGSAHVLALESTLDSQPTCRVCECVAGAASYGRSALDSRAESRSVAM